MHADADARLPGSLADTVRSIESDGGRAVPIVANLADPADRARIVPPVEAALGPVDILVHNAAAAIYASITEMLLRRRQTMFEVNVHAADWSRPRARSASPGTRTDGAGVRLRGEHHAWQYTSMSSPEAATGGALT